MLKILKSKIHGAVITGRDVHYEGSILIDASLLEMSGIHPFEEVQVWNRTNGNRFATYAIAAASGSGTVMVNGAAARLVEAGDHVIIAAYAYLNPSELSAHKPNIVLIGENNAGRLRHDI